MTPIGRDLFPGISAGSRCPWCTTGHRLGKEYDMNFQNAAYLVERAPTCSYGPRKVLVVTLDSDGVVPLDLRGAAVLVVAPALNSRLRHWLSDEDPARRLAAERLAATVDRLGRVGVRAEGRVGDADPMLAISDALRTFPADEIVFAGERRGFAPQAAAETVALYAE